MSCSKRSLVASRTSLTRTGTLPFQSSSGIVSNVTITAGREEYFEEEQKQQTNFVFCRTQSTMIIDCRSGSSNSPDFEQPNGRTQRRRSQSAPFLGCTNDDTGENLNLSAYFENLLEESSKHSPMGPSNNATTMMITLETDNHCSADVAPFKYNPFSMSQQQRAQQLKSKSSNKHSSSTSSFRKRKQHLRRKLAQPLSNRWNSCDSPEASSSSSSTTSPTSSPTSQSSSLSDFAYTSPCSSSSALTQQQQQQQLSHRVTSPAIVVVSSPPKLSATPPRPALRTVSPSSLQPSQEGQQEQQLGATSEHGTSATGHLVAQQPHRSLRSYNCKTYQQRPNEGNNNSNNKQYPQTFSSFWQEPLSSCISSEHSTSATGPPTAPIRRPDVMVHPLPRSAKYLQLAAQQPLKRLGSEKEEPLVSPSAQAEDNKNYVFPPQLKSKGTGCSPLRFPTRRLSLTGYNCNDSNSATAPITPSKVEELKDRISLIEDIIRRLDMHLTLPEEDENEEDDKETEIDDSSHCDDDDDCELVDEKSDKFSQDLGCCSISRSNNNDGDKMCCSNTFNKNNSICERMSVVTGRFNNDTGSVQAAAAFALSLQGGAR